MPAAARCEQEPDEPRRARLERDRVEAPVGGVRAGATSKPKPKYGRFERKIWATGLAPRPRRRRPGARGVRAEAADRADERARPWRRSLEFSAVVAGARLGLEAGAHGLERVHEAVGGRHAQRVERARGHLRRDGERGLAARRDAERAGDVVRPAGGHEGELGEPAERRVGRRAACRRRPRGPRGRRSRRRMSSTCQSSSSLSVTTALASDPSSARPARSSATVRSASSTPLARPFTTRRSSRRLLLSGRSSRMSSLLDLDQGLVDLAPSFEHPWLTAVFLVLSAWW